MKISKLHIEPNPYSRPQRPLDSIKAIVLHWVANPASSAKANRDYFELRKRGQHGYGSAHLIVDDTSVIEAVPLDEMAYHVGSQYYTNFAETHLGPYPNNSTIGVEMCHPDWTGEFTPKVWATTVELVGDILLANGLSPTAITTHKAITEKECPRWMVHHPDELDRFRWDVDEYMRAK